MFCFYLDVHNIRLAGLQYLHYYSSGMVSGLVFKSLELLPRHSPHRSAMKLKMPLKMHRILSLLAFVLALIGGILVVASALGGLGHFTIGSLAINGLVFLFGLGAIFGGWLIYAGVRKMGGIMTLIAGIILFVLTGSAGTSVLLVVVAGVLGLVAAELKPWWAFWR